MYKDSSNFNDSRENKVCIKLPNHNLLSTTRQFKIIKVVLAVFSNNQLVGNEGFFMLLIGNCFNIVFDYL